MLTKNTFEGVSVFASRIGHLKYGAAFALPGIGIFVNPKDVTNKDLLRHEFGHILQARIWGYKFFYGTIVSVSVKSARKANTDPDFTHQHTWTEWTANWFAYNYFNSPSDWNTKKYPLAPPENNRSDMYVSISKLKFDTVIIPKKRNTTI